MFRMQKNLQKIVLFKIYLFEKQKRKYDENEVYSIIGAIFFVLFSYITMILFFVFIQLFNELKNNFMFISCVIILCFLCKHVFVKRLKQDKYVQIIYEKYLKMDLKEREKNYKTGLHQFVLIVLCPIFCILIMKLMTIIL